MSLELPAESYVIGLDLGTSSCKGIAISSTGQVLAASACGYDVLQQQPGYAEQPPADWWQAVMTCVRDIMARLPESLGQPRAIGLAGQMHGLVVLSEIGTVLRPCMLWCDYRATQEAQDITAIVGIDHLLSVTCNPSRPAFTAPKLLWLRRHEPQVYSQIAHVLLPKDWIVYRLTEEFNTEPSDASGTGLCDVATGQWSNDIISRLGFARAWFPPIRPSSAIVGPLTARAAAELGLVPGIPVIAGAGDQAAAAVGIGAISERTGGCLVGTSGALITTLAQPQRDSFRHAVPDRWLLLNSMHAAGISMTWWEDVIMRARGEGLSMPLDLAGHLNASAPGADGLTFLPFLLGARDHDAGDPITGGFYGLRLDHEAWHVTRAILEGVGYELRRMLQGWLDDGVPIEAIRLTGGIVRAPAWVQMLSDILATPLQVMPDENAGALGVALLAFTGIGQFATIEQARQAIAIPPREVLPSTAAQYASPYQRYVNLYKHMRALPPVPPTSSPR